MLIVGRRKRPANKRGGRPRTVFINEYLQSGTETAAVRNYAYKTTTRKRGVGGGVKEK